MDQRERSVHIMEEERRRFARDLHDGPVQVLVNTSMRLELLERLLDVDRKLAFEEIARMRARLSQAIVEIRQLIYDLQPIALEEMGFLPALEALAHRIETDWRVPVRVALMGGQGEPVESIQSLIMYRAIQEAATNAAKHGDPHAIDIQVEWTANGLRVSVIDDGIGFEVAHGSKPGHYGLRTMSERLELLGGKVRISSQPGAGTRVDLVVVRP